MKRFRTPALTLIALAIATGALAATPLEEAGALAAQGQHAAAEARYEEALRADPQSTAARIGRGYVRAWQQKFGLAVADFRAVLSASPRNLEAQTGLGYALAWAGKHADAEAEFNKSLAIAPGNFDAQKGLAYNALWRKDAKTAESRFTALTASHPKDAELFVALGNAKRALGDEPGARSAFERALVIEPGRADARQALVPAQAAAPAPSAAAPLAAAPAGDFVRSYEATAYLGHTKFGSGGSKSGLRFVQLAVQATPSFRAWALYDGGLGLDNSALAQRNASADAYYVGGLLNWGGNLGTKLEIGQRDLGNGTDQNMLRAEQIFFLANGWVPKVGYWLGKSSGLPDETTLNAGISIPLTPRIRIEPMVFRSENAADERETRLLLTGEYTFNNGASLGLGFADGNKSNAGGADARQEVLLSAGWPISPTLQANLQARRESGAGLPDNDFIAAGLSAKF